MTTKDDKPQLKVRTVNGKEAVYNVGYTDGGFKAIETTAHTYNPFNKEGDFTAKNGDHLIIAATKPGTATNVTKESGNTGGIHYNIHQALIEHTAKITLEQGSINASLLGEQTLHCALVFRDKNGQALHTIKITDEQGSTLNPLDNPLGSARIVNDKLEVVFRADAPSGPRGQTYGGAPITPQQILAASQHGSVEIGQQFLKAGKELVSRKILPPSQHPDGLTNEDVHSALSNQRTLESLMVDRNTPAAQLKLIAERAKEQQTTKSPVPVAPSPHTNKHDDDHHHATPKHNPSHHLPDNIRRAAKAVTVNCNDCSVHVDQSGHPSVAPRPIPKQRTASLDSLAH